MRSDVSFSLSLTTASFSFSPLSLAERSLLSSFFSFSLLFLLAVLLGDLELLIEKHKNQNCFRYVCLFRLWKENSTFLYHKLYVCYTLNLALLTSLRDFKIPRLFWDCVCLIILEKSDSNSVQKKLVIY